MKKQMHKITHKRVSAISDSLFGPLICFLCMKNSSGKKTVTIMEIYLNEGMPSVLSFQDVTTEEWRKLFCHLPLATWREWNSMLSGTRRGKRLFKRLTKGGSGRSWTSTRRASK